VSSGSTLQPEALDQLAPNALRQLLQVRLEQLYGSLGDVHA
jgi:hypothetical protein